MDKLEALMQKMDFAFRQKQAVYSIIDLIKKLFTFKVPVKKIFASVIAVFQLIGAVIFDTPVKPFGDELDISGYELVFEDEFDGDCLDADIWEPHIEGKNRGGFDSMSQASVRDGNLILSGQYYGDEGKFGKGWYASSMQLKQTFTRGYFEISAIIVDNTKNSGDFWSAFWLTNGNAYNSKISQAGKGGIELDIMEAQGGNSKRKKMRSRITPALWCNGGDSNNDKIDGRNFGHWFVKKAFSTYHTYGLKWTEEGYTWYIDGVEVCTSNYKGNVCEVPETLIVSLELPNNEISRERDYVAEYKIDYVRVYQLPDDIGK